MVNPAGAAAAGRGAGAAGAGAGRPAQPSASRHTSETPTQIAARKRESTREEEAEKPQLRGCRLELAWRVRNGSAAGAAVRRPPVRDSINLRLPWFFPSMVFSLAGPRDAWHSRPRSEFLLPSLPSPVAPSARSSSSSRPASSSTGTFRLFAFSSLLPAFSPATTKSVFFDTDEATRAPRASRRAVASSRVSLLRLPVSTTVLPASSEAGPVSPPSPSPCGASRTGSCAGGSTPAAARASRRRRWRGSAKKARTLAATLGPTSATAISSSSLAASSAASEPKWRASSFATRSPTMRMPSAKRNRWSSRCRLASSSPSSLSADFSPQPSSSTSASASER